MKCPYCGSTAQVKRNYAPIIGKDALLKDNFTCGCGCNFDVEYADTDNGWEVSGVIMNYLEAREFE